MAVIQEDCGGGSMHALPVLNSHSLQTSQLFGGPSFAYPSICLSGLHKKLGNLHMGPGTQHLPVLQWGFHPSVSLIVVWGWCWGGKRPSVLVESGLIALLRTDHAHMGGWSLELVNGHLQVSWGLVRVMLQHPSGIPIVDNGPPDVLGPTGPRWLHRDNCIQKSHPHRPLPRLYVPPPTEPQTCGGQDTAWQGRSNLLGRDCKGPGNQAHQAGPYIPRYHFCTLHIAWSHHSSPP